MNTATSADTSILNAYAGSQLSLPDGCPKVVSSISGDTSGRVSYAFNSLGFRGEEFEPTADRHIFVCGCSITFGLGLDYSEAWVSVLRRGYAAVHDVPESSVNLQNFSSCGCSNGYITRTLIDQCARFRPSLAVALLTYSERAELLHEGRSYNIGRWCLADTYNRAAAADARRQQLRQLIQSKAKAFHDFYTPLAGDQELLKNALLLQLFFKSRDIPFVIGILRPGPGALPHDELVGAWSDCLDPARVFGVPLRECLVDESAAAYHPGPAGSRVIAEAFLSRYADAAGHARPSPEPLTTDAALAGVGPIADIEGNESAQIYPLF